MTAQRQPADASGRLQTPVSVGARVMAARQVLREAGIAADSADLDARLLAQHLLGWTTERFLAGATTTEPDGFGPAYEALVQRRHAREPLAYIVGHREFWGLDIEVTPDVLIPRPETELLVESVVEHFPVGQRSVAIVDACTGSGCVAVAIAQERSLATVVGTDISTAALLVAHRNAARHRVANRVRLVCADLLRGICGRFDAIVANPPYVPERDRSTIEPEVAQHEPAAALFAGPDGMSAIGPLLSQAAGRLREGGLLMFEFGFGQDEAVARLISATPELGIVALRRDLQGIPRVAIARRR